MSSELQFSHCAFISHSPIKMHDNLSSEVRPLSEIIKDKAQIFFMAIKLFKSLHYFGHVHVLVSWMLFEKNL